MKFSSKYRRETQACFYCPEMCRFSCSVAETLRTNTVTPRGKMSLLHLREMGVGDAAVVGSAAERTWFLEQCTGCGRCTEFCLHEIDVATELRRAREQMYGEQNLLSKPRQTFLVPQSKVLFFCEPERLQWWRQRPQLLERLEVREATVVELPAKLWLSGKLDRSVLIGLQSALAGTKKIWVESPEVAWFLAKAVKDEGALKAEIRTVWQQFFGDFCSLELRPEQVFHESYFYSRLLPRLGYSIPMYERGLMPFYSGWNVMDSGSEGFFKDQHPETAKQMAKRFLENLTADGRRVDKILCQSFESVEFLSRTLGVQTSYWLDEVFD